MATKKVNFTERRKEIVRISLSCRHLMVAGLFMAGIASNSLLAGAAWGHVQFSKRQDFVTNDYDFGKEEDVYIKVHLGDVANLIPGPAKVEVKLKQDIDGFPEAKLKAKRNITVSASPRAVSYRTDIQPLFTQDRAWFDNPDLAATACGVCHAGDDGIPPEECPPECHLMDLNTHAGMLNGADGGSEPIFGESSVGATDYDWAESALRKRLRNNRMPPGFPFEMDESNRNGPDVSTTDDGDDLALTGSNFYVKRHLGTSLEDHWVYEYSCCDAPNPNAAGLIGAWVNGTSAGLNEAAVVPYEGDADVTWSDVAPFFTQRDTWFFGSLACTFCHFDDEEPPSYHAMDLSTAAGLRAGADAGSEPILGESAVGATDFNWGASGLRKRLRNNRMPPESPFVLDESNRNGPTVVDPTVAPPGTISAVGLIGLWVDAGCPNN